MPITKQQIGLLALQALKVVEGDDTSAEPADEAVIEQAYDNVYAKLYSDGLVSWALADNIPDLFIDDVMWLMAASRITVFDPDQQTVGIILANSQQSIKNITENVALDYVPQIYPVESF